MNKLMRKINADKTAKQAVEYVCSNPCCICSCEEFCGVKYKGTCKIRRRLKIALLGAKKMEEHS